MKTWTIKYRGNIVATRKHGGSGLTGVAEIRATSLDEALAKFYDGFNQARVYITSITEEES